MALAHAPALGLGLSVFISVSLKSQHKAALAEFERRIAEHDEVMACYLMTGDSDDLIRVALPDLAALEKFILELPLPPSGPAAVPLRAARPAQPAAGRRRAAR